MLDIKVSAALMGFTQSEQRKILDAVYGGDTVSTERLSEAVKVVTQIIEDHEEVVEGYAGFPIEKELIQKNKDKFKDDRNIGRVISQGGQSMVITGLKSDGRYQVVGKKGEKTAKAPEDIGLNMQREHIDIDDLHQQMAEGLKQARKNVGASTCWDGYKAKGTKKKNGKEVPNCVKEDEQVEQETIEEKKKGLWANIHAKRKRGEAPAKKGDKDYPKTLNIEDILHDWDDEELDTISFEELEAICVEALEELDADVLTEALDIIDGMELLSEDYYDSAVKASKEASKTPAAKAGRANLRKEKMKAALKSAGSAVKKGLKTAGKAAAKGAGYAAGATVRAAKAGASEFKKGYDRGREGSTTKSKSSTAVSGDTTRSSSSSSGGSGESRVRLRDRIKSGIKKVVGGAARAVSRGSRNLARRMSEERYSWRKEMGMDE
tara:strand:- start:1289 stop:2593 length:1305 start_codon:yes stop_codon:yes gene_type:complete